MMVAELLFGWARAVGYIFLPSYDTFNDRGARFNSDTSIDLLNLRYMRRK
jgi:hypothetical protein